MKPGIYVDKIETNNYIFLFYKMDYSLFCCALKRELPKRALTCNRSLPIRALPIRALTLIFEYRYKYNTNLFFLYDVINLPLI